MVFVRLLCPEASITSLTSRECCPGFTEDTLLNPATLNGPVHPRLLNTPKIGTKVPRQHGELSGILVQDEETRQGVSEMGHIEAREGVSRRQGR